MYRKFLKRALDIVISFIGILVFALPMLVIAVAIKLDSKGPALFKTHRVGKNCKSFKFYKFRSMRTDAPEDCAPRLLQSDYTTKLGRFLRKTSLDELPQLFCIFVGDMSIVGPRPAGFSEQDLISEREKYGANNILPGLTGLAQIRGRDILASHPEEKAKVDGEYAQNVTFGGDVKIFFKTFIKVFRHDDVIEGKAALDREMSQDLPPDCVYGADNAQETAESAQSRAQQGLTGLSETVS